MIGAFALPWSLKLVNGFILDRYTFLPMGRRRAWIIGAQGLMIVGYLVLMVVAPGGRDVALLAPLAFVVSMATTFQDVSIDNLVIDVMTEEEQAKAGASPRTIDSRSDQAVDVAGSYRLTRNLDVTAGVRSLAGVEGAAYTSGLPMVLTGGITGITIPGVERRGTRAGSLKTRGAARKNVKTLEELREDNSELAWLGAADGKTID